MAELEMIIPDHHLSGEAHASPEQGAYAPTPNSTALLPEDHNLLPRPPTEVVEPTFELGGGGGGGR